MKYGLCPNKVDKLSQGWRPSPLLVPPPGEKVSFGSKCDGKRLDNALGHRQPQRGSDGSYTTLQEAYELKHLYMTQHP